MSRQIPTSIGSIAAVATLLACVAMLTSAASAKAQQEVKIGVLYPLSGPTAQIGIDAVAAIKTAVEMVNQGADLPLALAKNKGLPGLAGAKVTPIIVDHQGKPEVGQSETERLITQEKVHALIGAYFSSVTAAASQAAERAGNRAAAEAGSFILKRCTQQELEAL